MSKKSSRLRPQKSKFLQPEEQFTQWLRDLLNSKDIDRLEGHEARFLLKEIDFALRSKVILPIENLERAYPSNINPKLPRPRTRKKHKGLMRVSHRNLFSLAKSG